MNDKKNYQGWIGVYDSGVGGISVLKALREELPGENFIYFGDSANAPYGEKTDEEIRRLSVAAAEGLIGRGVKAIVIACNTATSVSAAYLRSRYPDLPIIAVEPALKPAALANPGRVLVMATPATIRLEKYQKLEERFSGEADIISLPCAGLAARIEKADLEGEDLAEMLEELLSPYRGSVHSVVLGCTHYPFIKQQIRKVLGDVTFYDGGKGTARELRRRLAEKGLLLENGRKGEVVFESSKAGDETSLYQWFFEQEI